MVVSPLLSKPPVLMSRSSSVPEPGTTSQFAREPVPLKVPLIRSTKVPDLPPTTDHPLQADQVAVAVGPRDCQAPPVALTLDVTVVDVDAAAAVSSGACSAAYGLCSQLFDSAVPVAVTFVVVVHARDSRVGRRPPS